MKKAKKKAKKAAATKDWFDTHMVFAGFGKETEKKLKKKLKKALKGEK